MTDRRALVRAMARLAAGPLAAWAFTRDWAEGTGHLVGYRFDGLELARIANDVRAEGVGPAGGLAGAAIQGAVILAAVAAAWLGVLALAGGERRLARWCAACLGGVAVALGAWSFTAHGAVLPPSGAMLLAAAAGLGLIGNGVRLARPRLAFDITRLRPAHSSPWIRRSPPPSPSPIPPTTTSLPS